MIDLSGKTAVVTGGSRGIGRAVCLMMAEAGANVVLGYHRDHAAAREVLDQVKALGRSGAAVAGDISQRAVVEAIFEAARQKFGQTDIVVGNAGIWKEGTIDEMSGEEWSETIDVNLTSIFHTCQVAVREMKPRRSGRIILISSTAGQRGEARYSHYAASKGAIIALTKSLGSELGPFNIRVNAVAPGWVDTDMAYEVMNDPERRMKIENEIPLRRIPSARDIAGPILFLASDLSNHLQGEVINVNGGSVMCG